MRTTEMGAWTPGSGLIPGMRRPVRRITVPSIPLRKMAFGEPTSSGASGVMVAALSPYPVSFIAAAASCTTWFSVARRFSSERSYLLNSRFNPVTEGSRTRKDSSRSSCPVWSPSITIMVLRSTLSPRKRSLTHVLRLVYDGLPHGAPMDRCLREEIYKLQVLELGSEGGGELGPVSGLAHASGDPEEGLGELVVARRAVEHDQLLPADLGDLRRALFRKAVLGVHYQHELV